MKLTSFINRYIWEVILNKKCHRCNRCIHLLSKFGIHKIIINYYKLYLYELFKDTVASRMYIIYKDI